MNEIFENRAKRLKKVFAKRLYEARMDMGYSLVHIAQRLGVNTNSIRQWENSQEDKEKVVFPNSRHLANLCHELNVSANHLLNLDPYSIEHEHKGIKWLVSKPPNGSSFNISDFDIGAKLFNFTIMTKNRKPEEITLNELENFHYHQPAITDKAISYNIEGELPNLSLELPKLIRALLFAKAIQVLQVPRDGKKEKELLSKYKNLKYCIVAKLDHLPEDNSLTSQIIRREMTAFLAAMNITRFLRHVKSVGLTGGRVVSRFCDLAPPFTLSGKNFIALLQQQPTDYPAFLGANDLIAKLISMDAGIKGYRMPFINSERRDKVDLSGMERYEKDELESARRVLALAQDVQTVIMSVGAVKTNIRIPNPSNRDTQLRELYFKLNSEERDRTEGDILRQLTDNEGLPVGSEQDQAMNASFVYSISLRDLKKIAKRGHVWIIAARKEKVPVIQGALRAGLANCLVIENTIATGLLNYSSDKQSGD